MKRLYHEGIYLVNKFLVLVLLVSIFSFTFNNVNVQADGLLEINGPSEAFEGEEVILYVTLDGKPIQARVTFGDSLSINKTNSSTGQITFTMPSVPIGNKEFLINASIPGNLSASHYILVKNKTKMLEIELTNNYIGELDEFNVTVSYDLSPIEGANIWFNSSQYTTDEQGIVTLTAPDVLISTNFGLIANKTGYIANSTIITVLDSDVGNKLMEVIYPFIIESGSEEIIINIMDKHGGLENVMVHAYYEDNKYGEYLTDSNGNADIEVPIINNNNYFSLIVEKDGYKRYENTEIIINFFSKNLEHNLEISINPSEVYEGDIISTIVTDELDKAINGADIWRGSYKIQGTTDSNGIKELNAPSVFFDREYYIYAIKTGYNFAENKITIRNIESDLKQLIIEFDNSVNESNIFYIVAKDENGQFIEGVTFTFNLEQKITDKDGSVYFSAPNITQNSFYTINANKYGYYPITSSIEIVDIEKSNGDSHKKIKICTLPIVTENEEFTVTIRDENDNLLSNVRVTFMDNTQYTDFTGTVTFSAPEVSWDRINKILVVKSGYESSTFDITIKNNEGFEYIFLVIIIVVILLIGVIYYFRFRQIV